MTRAIALCLLLALPAPLLARRAAPAGEAPRRTLKLCVPADAPAEVRDAGRSVLAAVSRHPLLTVLAEGRPPADLTDTRKLAADRPESRAYSHLVILGPPTDPLVMAAWQREARLTETGLYVFGYGQFSSEIGYVEADRNPFLHGQAIPTAPFETEVVTITGTTPRAIALAARAFLERDFVNGVVAAPGWKRTGDTLLQRDPLSPDFTLPAWLPERLGAMPRIGVTQASEDEYRGVLADTGVSPREIWRAKYYPSGAWDGAGAERAYDHYSAGLHRRAYGNTLWCARFASTAEAAAAAPKIAAAANLTRQGTAWRGQQPPYGFQAESSGPLALWQHGEWLLMSTLPEPETQAAQQRLGG